MERRKVIKQLFCIAGAAIVFPYCMADKSKSSIILKKIEVDGEQEKLLAELSETIIPATDTPGARDISAHLFALMMIDDCYKKDDQQKFLAGLKAFEEKTKKQFDKSFVACTTDERKALLTELGAKKTNNPELDYFYATTKRLTIQAYTTSKYFLTNVQEYKLVPGRYYGCVLVKAIS